jgi:hypothetical protein
MKKLLMLTAAVFALQALPALAEEGAAKEGHKRGDFFEKVDTNKDGKISKAEFEASNKERGDKKFAEMDKDGDGNVTKEEGKAHHEAKKAEWEKRKAEHKAKMDAEKPADAPKAE